MWPHPDCQSGRACVETPGLVYALRKWQRQAWQGSSRASTAGSRRCFWERLDDWIGGDHLVRVVDLFVEELDLSNLGFERASPRAGSTA